MKKSMGVIVSLFSLWAGVLSVQADLIADNFNRSGIGYSSNAAAALVDANWTNGVGQTAQWAISSQRIITRTLSGSGNAVVVNTALETLSGSGKSFTLSADLTPLIASNWAGVVWGYQDASNYYFLQMKAGTNTYQVYSMVNGVMTRLGASESATGNFTTGSVYTVTITSTNAYDFGIEITATAGGTVLASTSRTDTGSSFADGYAGLILTTPGSTSRFAFDNFSLEVIPEPATIGLLGGGTIALLLMRRVWWRK